MLGSFFDLDREIERIASERETGAVEAKDKRIQAYSDFDRRIEDFVRSVSEDERPDGTDEGEESRPVMSPATVPRAAGPLHQIR